MSLFHLSAVIERFSQPREKGNKNFQYFHNRFQTWRIRVFVPPPWSGRAGEGLLNFVNRYQSLPFSPYYLCTRFNYQTKQNYDFHHLFKHHHPPPRRFSQRPEFPTRRSLDHAPKGPWPTQKERVRDAPKSIAPQKAEALPISLYSQLSCRKPPTTRSANLLIECPNQRPFHRLPRRRSRHGRKPFTGHEKSGSIAILRSLSLPWSAP